jgi:transcriptional antiterminator NusG
MAMCWYIVHAHTGFEDSVAAAIREQAENGGCAHLFDHEVCAGGAMVPIERVIEVRRGERADAERKHFPGYVFVRCEMTDALARVLRAIPHVTGFLGTDDRPMPVADAEINRMLAT